MKKYTSEDIRGIISDVKCSANLLSRKGDRFCTSAEELINEVSEYKKYVISEKREKWCDSFQAIFYDVVLVIPPILGSNMGLKFRAIENNDNKIIKDILVIIYVAQIMESYEENHNITDAINTLESLNLDEQTRISVIHEVLRFSMFGPEFVSTVSPNLIEKNNFKYCYLENSKYLEQRNKLESRLAYAIKVKETLEEYKKYCVEYYRYECDNTKEKLAERKRILERIGNDKLQEIVNNTYLFAKYLIKLMKDENNTYQDDIFTSIPCGDGIKISLGCAGGHFADELYDVDYNGKTIFISDYLLKNILDGVSIESDEDVEEHIDGDIGCIYEYPKLTFSMKLNKFNEYYSEFFETKTRNINL